MFKISGLWKRYQISKSEFCLFFKAELLQKEQDNTADVL